MTPKLIRAACFASLWLSASVCSADWPADPTKNLPVAVANSTQDAVNSLPDGLGGFFLVWEDSRDSLATGFDIYAQHIDATGIARWAANGTPVVRLPGDQIPSGSDSAILAADGAGGIFVGFLMSESSYRARLQRLNVNGVPQWGDSGVAISATDGDQINPRLLADGSGGVFVSWSGVTSSNIQAVYAQRFDGSGTPLWSPNGVVVCISVVPQAQEIVTDGSGGVILSWQDYRRLTGGDVYAQRLSATGTPQWVSNGVRVCPTTGDQELLEMASDGQGGALMTWSDFESGPGGSERVFAQRLSGAGLPTWNPAGVQACASDSSSGNIDSRVVSDGSGGAILDFWDERSSSTGQDIYSQRISANGVRLWGEGGDPLCIAPGRQINPRLISDGSGGAIAAWSDMRLGPTPDIYAQRVNANGVRQWPLGGVAISIAPKSQDNATIASDGAGGALIAWEDQRTDASDIYAQNVHSDGTLGGGVVAVGISLVDFKAEPDMVTVHWSTASLQSGPFLVERESQGAVWAVLGPANADASGGIHFTDRAVRPGGRYGYRLGVFSNGAEWYSSEVWVDVPAALSLSLEGLRPNPATSSNLVLSFGLPDAQPATVEFLDIQGRCVERRQVESLGPGEHVLPLALGSHMRPGVYMIRLTQGNRSLTKRAVIVR